ncbi:MAG: hypothetical protein ABL889_17865 [Terricaulis sp.]
MKNSARSFPWILPIVASLVRALGSVFGARMSANRAREMLITLMWIGFGALALVVVANA